MARNTLRGAFVLVLDSEQGAVAHELGKVCVYDAVALLDRKEWQGSGDCPH